MSRRIMAMHVDGVCRIGFPCIDNFRKEPVLDDLTHDEAMSLCREIIAACNQLSLDEVLQCEQQARAVG